MPVCVTFEHSRNTSNREGASLTLEPEGRGLSATGTLRVFGSGTLTLPPCDQQERRAATVSQALQQQVDTPERGYSGYGFVILTDSETWYGSIHPSQALQKYRQKTSIPAKLAVVGMVSNGFSIADPNDAGMLDIVGMSTDTPNLISSFVGDRSL